MKEKVLLFGKYPRNNQIVTHVLKIERIAENIYYYVSEKSTLGDENDMLGIVLQICKNYFNIGYCRRKTIHIPENLKKTKEISENYGAFLISKMQNNQPVTLIDLKICEVLNIDRAPFVRYRELKGIKS